MKYLLTCHGLHSIGLLVDDEANELRNNLTDIEITRGTGKAGIAYWLNSFLDLDDSAMISENHPSVWQIQEWVSSEYEKGRLTSITDEEILNVAKTYLPQRFEAHA